MPSLQDMEFAKLLAAKNMISKIELQKYLDELDELIRSGRKVTLQQLLYECNVISKEQKIKAPQKKTVYCDNCGTQYHVQKEDIGISFKCKKCAKMMTVSDVQATPSAAAVMVKEPQIPGKPVMVKEPQIPEKPVMVKEPQIPEKQAQNPPALQCHKSDEAGQVVYEYDFMKPAKDEAKQDDQQKKNDAVVQELGMVEEISMTKAPVFLDCKIPDKFVPLPLELFLAINREAPVENVSEWWAFDKKGELA